METVHLNYSDSGPLEKEKREDGEQLPGMSQDFWMALSDPSTPLCLQKCGVRTRGMGERTELNVSVGAWRENIQINTTIFVIE